MKRKFKQGVFQQERIDCLWKELVRVLSGTGGMKLTETVKQMNHHYKDDRSGVESLRRYFSMGVFPGIEYKDGNVYFI